MNCDPEDNICDIIIFGQDFGRIVLRYCFCAFSFLPLTQAGTVESIDSDVESNSLKDFFSRQLRIFWTHSKKQQLHDNDDYYPRPHP